MCGIFISCSQKEHEAPSEKLLDDLKKRGPDHVGIKPRTASLENTTRYMSRYHIWHLNFVSTVLSLRGDCIVRQPLEDPKSGCLLCWNGEAWKINNKIVKGNDAEAVFSLLLNAAQPYSTDVNNEFYSDDQCVQNIFKAIASIAGPFAFVFLDAKSNRIFYGRDALGRRSLLSKSYEAGSFAIASVSDATENDGWIEVEADGINMLHLGASGASLSQRSDGITHIPWAIGLEPDSPYTLVQSLLFDIFPHLLRHRLTPDIPIPNFEQRVQQQGQPNPGA